jgi:hypothetical protein
MFENDKDRKNRLCLAISETDEVTALGAPFNTFGSAEEAAKRAHSSMFGSAEEAAKRAHSSMFGSAAEVARRQHPELFETAAEAARRHHPELFASLLEGASGSILDKQISSYAHVNAFLAPTGIEALRSYEAKQKEEFTNLIGSLSGALAQKESEKMLASTLWKPFQEWPEVKPSFLGMSLHRAIESDDSREIERIMRDPAFGVEVIKAMHQAAKMSVLELEATEKELTEACDNQNALRAIVLHAGVQAMVKENTIFSDEKKEEIRTEFSKKRRSNTALSDDAIYGLLVISFGSSKSTIRRIVLKK